VGYYIGTAQKITVEHLALVARQRKAFHLPRHIESGPADKTGKTLDKQGQNRSLSVSPTAGCGQRNQMPLKRHKEKTALDHPFQASRSTARNTCTVDLPDRKPNCSAQKNDTSSK